MEFNNFKLEIISSKYYHSIYNYYKSNKEHLEPWEPTRAKDYYTLDFHIKRTDERLDLMKKNQSMHFILINNIEDEIIGVCNYTHINGGECWLGYSISKLNQGLGYMYKTVINANKHMLNKYNIKKINAGIITKNQRSLKLINRLSFESTGKFVEKEINHKVEKLEIFSFPNP